VSNSLSDSDTDTDSGAAERVDGLLAARARGILDGSVPPPPIAQLIGFRPLSAEPGRAVFALDTDLDRHANPMGTLHGGILCDLADIAMGSAFASTLADDETFTTLELKINFLRPVWQTRLTAVGRVVQRGRTVGLVECDITDAEGRLVARASSTCMTLRGAQAHGR
jgi:uncharacterized protein (TIGR00369 family)